MENILFVCKGNIFRSVTAEFALRRCMVGQSAIAVASAGTMNAPELEVRPDVMQYLAQQGLDVSRHERRTLTADMLGSSDLVISMSTDHVDTLSQQFQFNSELFSVACGRGVKALPDVDDLFPVEQRHSAAAWLHISKTIDEIIEHTNRLASRIEQGCYGVV